MDKKCILFLSARSDLGGGPKNMFKLVSALVLTGQFNIVVACPDEGIWFQKYKDLSLNGKLELYDLKLRRLKFNNFLKLYSIIKRHRVKIVCSHGKGAGLWARTLRILKYDLYSIHFFRGIHLGNMKPLSKFFYKKLEYFLGFLTNYHVCVSKAERELAINLKFTDNDKSLVIHNSINTDAFKPVDCNQKIKLKKEMNIVNEFNLLTVARYSYAKNIKLILDIVKDYKKINGAISLILVGGEEDYTEKDVNRWIEERNLEENILITGPKNDVIPYYLVSDIFINTSRWEGLPTTVLEAQACGLPVIASNVIGNNCAVIDGITGFLVTEKNINEYIYHIRQLYENTKLRTDMGKEGVKFVSENFREEQTVKKFIDVLSVLD